MNPLTLYLRSPRLNIPASCSGAKKSGTSVFLLEPQNETETHLPFFYMPDSSPRGLTFVCRRQYLVCSSTTSSDHFRIMSGALLYLSVAAWQLIHPRAGRRRKLTKGGGQFYLAHALLRGGVLLVCWQKKTFLVIYLIFFS